jgi:hypothetical protein
VSDPTKYEDENDLRALNDAITLLSSRFKNIQIFATRHLNDEEGTLRFVKGSGDYYARFGVVHQWCEAQTILKVSNEGE